MDKILAGPVPTELRHIERKLQALFETDEWRELSRHMCLMATYLSVRTVPIDDYARAKMTYLLNTYHLESMASNVRATLQRDLTLLAAAHVCKGCDDVSLFMKHYQRPPLSEVLKMKQGLTEAQVCERIRDVQSQEWAGVGEPWEVRCFTPAQNDLLESLLSLDPDPSQLSCPDTPPLPPL